MQFDIFYSYVADKWRWIIVNPSNGHLLATGNALYSSSSGARKGARRFFDKIRGPGYVIFNVIPRENANALRSAKRYKHS